jgi:hypothetical protein
MRSMTAAEVSTLLEVWSTFCGVSWSSGAGADPKRGHSTFYVALVCLGGAVRIPDRVLRLFLSASEYHQMECREQGCVAGP